jgi:hypothetical protein
MSSEPMKQFDGEFDKNSFVYWIDPKCIDIIKVAEKKHTFMR